MTDDDRLNILCVYTRNKHVLNALHACYSHRPCGPRKRREKWNDAWKAVREISYDFNHMDIEWLQKKAQEESRASRHSTVI